MTRVPTSRGSGGIGSAVCVLVFFSAAPGANGLRSYRHTPRDNSPPNVFISHAVYGNAAAALINLLIDYSREVR